MIHPHDNETQTRWDRGELQVQLVAPGNSKPLGFCDGSEQDMRELIEIAESEGAEGIQISKKVLKTGREIWTVTSDSATADAEPVDE